MAIVILLAIKTIITIVTVLAIKTDMAIVTVLAIETNIAIVTALAIKTNIYFFGIEPGINAKNSSQCNIRSIVFCVAVFPWLGTLCRVVTLLVTIKTGNMT